MIYRRPLSADDKHSTDPLKNDGLAKVSYPAGFHGKSKIEVKYLDGDLLDEGEIQV